ncbi:MAG: ShlB/FhaC/HecB family hemolysin secretion/activation protein [Spirulinaceae cyanobacterium]
MESLFCCLLLICIGSSPLVAQTFPEQDIQGFVFRGNALLTNEELQKRIKVFNSGEDLEAVQAALLEAYREAGYHSVQISLPEDADGDGIFQVEIQETPVAPREIPITEISVTGNQHFNKANIRAALPELREDSLVDFEVLAQQLFLANDNPSRQLTLNIFPAELEQKAAKVEIQVTDRNPQYWQATLDNSGTAATGNTRLSLVSQNHNLFNQGHLAALSLSLSPEKIEQVTQIGLFYQAPIPTWGDTISFTASYSDVDSGRIANLFDVSGQGFATGINWLHNLYRSSQEQHSLELGLNYRFFNNEINFIGTNFGVDVAAFPAQVGYKYSFQGEKENLRVGVSYLHNLPGVFDLNDNSTYNLSRVGADSDWDIWLVNGVYQYSWESGWQLKLQGEGQYAGEPLISGEQLGLGGRYSIRGLQEREVSGDNGLRGTIELYSPNFWENHRFLVFTDFGAYSRENSQPGEVKGDTIWSTGLGWRWHYERRLFSAVDLGYVLNGSSFSQAGEVKVHFLLHYSF